jgi:hypothetical protein
MGTVSLLWGKGRRGVALTTHPHLVPRLKKEYSYTFTTISWPVIERILYLTFTFTEGNPGTPYFDLCFGRDMNRALHTLDSVSRPLYCVSVGRTKHDAATAIKIITKNKNFSTNKSFAITHCFLTVYNFLTN